MAKYLILGSYTVEGTRGVIKEGGSGRTTMIEKALKSGLNGCDHDRTNTTIDLDRS